jgi:hypothetical protein
VEIEFIFVCRKFPAVISIFMIDLVDFMFRPSVEV